MSEIQVSICIDVAIEVPVTLATVPAPFDGVLAEDGSRLVSESGAFLEQETGGDT